jgi:Zn-dependent peptidase ImmA (M78 family)
LKVITESPNPNPNFLKAWEYVEMNYAYLIRDAFLISITLTDDATTLPPHADGVHIWLGAYAIIRIINDRSHTVGRFVEVLVHELTHLVQHSSGRAHGMTVKQLEDEAYPAGQLARHLYELNEFEALAQQMKTATIQRRWAA